MKLPRALEFLRRTSAWQAASDRRYLRRNHVRREFYRQFVHPDSLVFDIGANVGHYVLLFQSLGAKVLAVEPQASLVAGLQRRFARQPRVQIVRTALGSKPGTATLHKTDSLSEIASLREDIANRSRFAAEHKFSQAETVPVITLDALIAQHGRPGFCKIDVEGFESEVLAGLTQPVPMLSLEFNREFRREIEQCLARLDQLGAYQFNFALGETTAWAQQTWCDSRTMLATLAANPDPLLWGDIYARLA